ncbi:serpin family protein [Nocardioides sp. SYSU DS0663]|uniref:serpin family protein n=1 Tax=Nocardioides sp. SYSU DS0663 TaxID=3416445 RepID=UPI003F4C591D
MRIDYAGRDLAMTVVLPDEGRLEDVEALLADGGLAGLLEGRPEGVQLELPRWTFRTQARLKDALAALGMPTAFDREEADLTAMSEEEGLHVAAVLHEVFVTVDEEGTEAAAATAVVVTTESMPPPLTPFVVDRPFLFVVHDVRRGVPLFLGRLADPRG